jgi:hypothetical protein
MGRLVLVVLLFGCGSSSEKHPDAAVPDVAVDAGLAWQSVETVSNDGQVIVERVSYQVDGLRVFGRVCRPAAAGVYPLIVYNHL